MSGRRLLVLLLALAVLFVLPASAVLAQCAMCKAALEGSSEGRALGTPLNQAILLLLTAPYLVFGCFVLVALRERIGSRARRTLRTIRQRTLQRLVH